MFFWWCCFLDFSCFLFLYIDVCIFEIETYSSPCRLALSGKAHPGFWKGRLACSGAGLAAGVLRQAGLVAPVFLRDKQRSEINWAGKKVVKDEFTEVVTFELDFEK